MILSLVGMHDPPVKVELMTETASNIAHRATYLDKAYSSRFKQPQTLIYVLSSGKYQIGLSERKLLDLG